MPGRELLASPIPTVLEFFRRSDWGEPRGYEAACQEIARRIAQATGESLDWPECDAEKVFAILELLSNAGIYHTALLNIKPANMGNVPTLEVMTHLRGEIVKM